MKKRTSKSASATPKAFSRSGTSAKTAATVSKPIHRLEPKSVASSKFIRVLKLAKKKKTQEEALESLLDIGILTKSGTLAAQYKAKSGGKDKASKAVTKMGNAKSAGKMKI